MAQEAANSVQETKDKSPTAAGANVVVGTLQPSSAGEQWRQCAFTVGGTKLTFVGYSRAAERTGFYLQEFKWFFDAGGMASVDHRPRVVFITHCHSDHTFGLPFMVSSRHHTDIFAPSPAVPFLDKYIESSQFLNSSVNSRDAFPYADLTLAGVQAGQVLSSLPATSTSKKKKKNGRKFGATVVHCFHGVPCVGYGVHETRKRLKSQYAQLPGKELGALRKAGHDISEQVNIPLFMFLGDTSVEALSTPQDSTMASTVDLTDSADSSSAVASLAPAAVILSFPLIFVECTILRSQDLSPDQTAQRGHIHWESLRPVVKRHPHITWVVMHISSRYKAAEVGAFFELERTQHGIDNVVPWV